MILRDFTVSSRDRPKLSILGLAIPEGMTQPLSHPQFRAKRAESELSIEAKTAGTAEARSDSLHLAAMSRFFDPEADDNPAAV